MNTATFQLTARLTRFRLRRREGFTMFEVLIVIVALGLLAALVIPTVDRFLESTGDAAKTRNAQTLNQYAEALHNAGVDTNWADINAALKALTDGVTLPSVVPKGAAQVVKLKQTVNPAAYGYTAGDSTKPAVFTPKLGDRTQRP